MNSIWLAIANYFKFFICLYIWLQNSCFFPRPWKIHVIGINKTCQWSSQSYKQCHGNSWWHTPCHRGLLTHENHVTRILSVIQTMLQEFTVTYFMPQDFFYSFKPCHRNSLSHSNILREFTVTIPCYSISPG